MRLYELPDAIREALDRAVDPETGEITEALGAELDALEEEFERKAEYIALLSREAKAEAAAVKVEENRLAARRQAAENRERRLKDYLQGCMIAAGIDRIEGERAKVRIQSNSRPSITWRGDPENVPEAFRRMTVSVDTAAAYEELKAGAELPEGFEVQTGVHCRVW